MIRAALVLVMLLLAQACTGGGDARDPDDALAAAAERLAAAETIHVEVSSQGLPEEGTVLVRASGDAARPDAFDGVLQIRTMGVTADVEVRSTGGQVYARLPFTDELAPVDPADLGFSDPATLISEEAGIGRLLTEAESVTSAGEERLDGEVVDVVDAQIPGELVAELLTSADPTAPVAGVFRITRDDAQVRQVELTGPFYDAEIATTYTVRLTDWDDPVEIPPPDGG